MPHSNQAKKRLRQAEKHRLRNRSMKREIKTITKEFAEQVAERNVEEANKSFRLVISKLDKAAKRHIYHLNTVARRKSQAAALLNSLESAASH